MSEKKTGYHFTMSVTPNGSKQQDSAFIADDVRLGMDILLKRADELAPGVGKAIGQGLREIVEKGGPAALKEGVPHKAHGKASSGTGTLVVTALPKLG